MTPPLSKGYSRFLRILAIIFISLPLSFFALGVWQYGRAGYAERRLGILNAGDVYWLPLLFLLPIAAQVITICVLYKKSSRDRSVATFFLFCLRVMTLCPLGYCVLWSVYPLYGGQWLSISALVGVCALLFAVGVMTYAIIRVPPKQSSVLIGENDIEDVVGLCEALSAGKNDKYIKVFENLPQEVKEKVQEVATVTTNLVEEKTEFIRVMNEELLPDRNFHASFIGVVKPNDREIKGFVKDKRKGALSEEKVRRWNRRILDCQLEGHLAGTKHHCLWRIENFLNALHWGAAATSFWALTFFFTVFLGATYLFAFAFGFHDRSVKSTGAVPALYMSRNRPSDAVDEPAFAESGASLAAVTWPDYVFHYAGEDTVATVNSTQTAVEEYKELVKEKSELEKRKGDRAAERGRVEDKRRGLEIQRGTLNALRSQQLLSNDYSAAKKTDDLLKPVADDLNQQLNREKEIAGELAGIEVALNEKSNAVREWNRRWKENVNREHFERMLTAINAETSYGEGILIELKGGARQGDVTRNAQPANSLLDERRWKLKYQVLTRLAESRAIPSSFTWVDLPEELPPVPRSSNPSQSDKLSLEQLLHDPRLGGLEELVKANLDETASKDLKQWLADLSDKDGGQFIYANNPKLRAALQRLLGFVPQEQVAYVREKNYSRKLAHALAEFREAYDGRSLASLGEAGSEDYITVSVKPVQKPQHAIPLGLMDYVYFTVYTITTTGYGDIVPTTTYAKFLCTFANIIEVFFLVVFFNALLSVRRT